ncbi:BnaAnng41170D [Brassica napus]|uniref:BnaAnng41170D protein n=1 Tax=Brassica napus TaxID=3708 RepID=A0A078JXR9_BRANA|nr:BnaAnng41170D [Brassica napus]
MYMFFNCLYRKYKNELLTKQSHQGRRNRAIDIDREVHINFSEWIRQKVQTNEIDGITDDLRCLAMGPSEKVLKYTAYNVNGFKFWATEREANLKTQNNKVIVHFDEVSGQPIGESGGLLGSWLGQLSNDVNLLPINYSDWRMVNPHIKNKVWEVIQSKFWFDDPATRKVFVMSALGSRCKDVKLRLWKEYKRDSLSETLLNRPENVPENQWGHFVHMRFTEKWKEKLTTLLGQKSHVTNNAIASLDDEYAQVFGPERPGRIENSEMVIDLKSQVKELSDQVKGMTTFIQQVIGTSTGEQARVWASSFAVAFVNIPNPAFANVPSPPNPNQERSDDAVRD